MKKTLLFLFTLTPFIASAFAFPDIRSFSDELVSVLKIVLNISIMIAFIAFFWGLAKFILASGNEKAITDGKQFMLYGIFALFALVSMQGILIFLSSQLGFGSYLEPPLLPAETANSTINFWTPENLE